MIPVYRPDLSGNERKYVLDCMDSSWISSIGIYGPRFEKAISDITGAKHAIAVSNGTVALHLAMHCLDLGPGDEVIVPTLTYISSVNTIAQTGATPVFADCRPEDWQLDPAEIERLVSPRTKAVMPVHLYGAACDMLAIQRIASAHGLRIVEDAAEALGTMIGDRHAGLYGNVGTLSFFGNKTITTGEGGMVITDDDELAAAMRMTKGQGQSLTKRYWHERMGFNYRMTNIAAAIGCAQTERFDAIVARKKEIGSIYRRLLHDVPVSFQARAENVVSAEWLVSLLLPRGVDRDRLMEDMAERGVETRPVFFCAHQMPMYHSDKQFPVSEDISARGISLPSFPALTMQEIERVCEVLRLSLAARHAL